MSSGSHPQTDGHTKSLNQCLESYLRCMVHQNLKLWVRWLALAEYWYNTNYYSGLKATPFEALYGIRPPMHFITQSLPIHNEDAQELLTQRQAHMQELRDNLVLAQNRMKQYADKQCTKREFLVGDLVYQKLQPFRQKTQDLKFSTKYYDPYKILERIGNVAYKLELPEGSKIHPIFHVSLLKQAISPNITPVPDLPITDQDGVFVVVPSAILQEREAMHGGRRVQ